MKKALIFLLALMMVLIQVSASSAAGLDYTANVMIYTDAIPEGKNYLTADTSHRSSNEYRNFYTYQGHLIRLVDSSIFNLGSSVDERSGRSIAEALQGGFIATSWIINPSQIINQNKIGSYTIEYDVIYNNPLTDNISLSSTWKKGISGSNLANIDLKVLACPAIDCVQLGGEQRSGHQQYLIVVIAQDPENPPKAVNIDIPGSVIGESTARYSDRNEFLIITVPFVTYNEETRDYTYYVDVTGSDDKVIHKEGTFTVLADGNPHPQIEMAEKFYRNENGEASVNAKYCGDTPDDEVTFDWYVKSSSGETLRGTNGETGDASSQVFNISTPGKYQMVLTMTEKTVEARSATATKAFTVENTAPKIGIGESSKPNTMKLGLVLLNYTEGSEALDALNNSLRENDIIADIHTASVPEFSNSESLPLLTANGVTDYSSYISAGAVNELGPRADGTFPIFDSLGNVNYVIKPIDDLYIEIYSIDGKFIDRRSIPSGNVLSRQPFGIEMQHGTIYVVFTKYDSCSKEMLTIETVKGSSKLDGSISLAQKDYTESYKFGNTIVMGLYNKIKKSNIYYVHKFTPNYEWAKSKLEEKYFSDENDLNLFIDASGGINASEIISACNDARGGSSSGSGSTGQASPSISGDFKFTYSDLDGDPMYKAYYEYNGVVSEINSLEISVNPVAGSSSLKFWVVDNCGNSAYNKKSNVITVYLDGREPEVPDAPEVKSVLRLHRIY